MVESFREIIQTWPTRRAMADALGNVNRDQVLKWYERDFIPPEYWHRVARKMRRGENQRRDLVYRMSIIAARRLGSAVRSVAA